MRILILTNNLQGENGWSKYSLDYLREISALGNEILVLVCKKENDLFFCKQKKILSSPLKYLRNPVRAFLASVSINRAIKQFHPDIIHFMVEPYALILPFLRIGKAKTCLTIHGTYAVLPLLKKRTKILAKLYYKKINGIVAVSRYTKNYLKRLFPKLGVENKIRVITNGVVVGRESSFKIKKNQQGNKKRILFVGAIKSRKGIIQSIEALNFYQKNYYSDFIFEIFGRYNPEDEYVKKIKEFIKKYKLEQRVFLNGLVSQTKIEQAYQSADLYLMLPIEKNHHFEGFGLVFLEANSFGVPCIGSSKSCCEEAIKNKFSGFLVNAYNPQEIAERIKNILDDSLIKRKDCLAWAERNDIKIKANQLRDFYLKLLGKTDFLLK